MMTSGWNKGSKLYKEHKVYKVYKGFFLSQGAKNCKIKAIDFSAKNSLISFVNLFPNRIFYCIFKFMTSLTSYCKKC